MLAYHPQLLAFLGSAPALQAYWGSEATLLVASFLGARKRTYRVVHAA